MVKMELLHIVGQLQMVIHTVVDLVVLTLVVAAVVLVQDVVVVITSWVVKVDLELL